MELSPEEQKLFHDYEASFLKGEDSKLKNPFLSEDMEQYSWKHQIGGDYGDFTLVGRNPKSTKSTCGTFHSLWGCLNVEEHGITIDGCDYRGKVPVFKRYYTCHRADCPVCYKNGWARRQAHSMTERLKKFSTGFIDEKGRKSPPRGKVEHSTVSISPSDYGLDFDKMKHKAIRGLLNRGIYGGCLVFHGFRYCNYVESLEKGMPFGWRWSPHFHCLGFIRGGFRKCRKCPYVDVDERYRHACSGCSGFYGRSKELYKKDKLIVKVMGERKTILGTCWYELDHATLRKSVRSNAVWWFGVCSKRKYKVKVEKEKHCCPICGAELVRLRYWGEQPICVDRSAPFFKSSELVDYFKNGVRQFDEYPEEAKSWA